MVYTMEDFKRDHAQEQFLELTPESRRVIVQALPPDERREMLRLLLREVVREILQSLPEEELLAALAAEQLRDYLDRPTPSRPAEPPKPRRKR